MVAVSALVALARTVEARVKAGSNFRADTAAPAIHAAEEALAEIYGKEVERIGDVTESRAKLIARDQTSKMNGAFNEARQTSLGIDRYVWQTSGDERVREEHQANDGQVFSWNDPPATGHLRNLRGRLPCGHGGAHATPPGSRAGRQPIGRPEFRGFRLPTKSSLAGPNILWTTT